MSQQGWGDGNANSGVYDGGQNQTPSSTGVILHERVLPQAPANETIRQTGVQSSANPTVFPADVSIRDANGNPFSISNPLPVAASPTPFTNVQIFNPIALLAATEYAFVVPADTGTIRFRCRNNAKLQYTFTSGASNSIYFTLDPGIVEDISGAILTGKTLYFQVNKPNTTIEILTISI
jgi:hypothetical protein